MYLSSHTYFYYKKMVLIINKLSVYLSHIIVYNTIYLLNSKVIIRKEKEKKIEVYF